tara:strand:- start:69 stop:476 length:408 start_codon:yes stop_codon:yes gene_type:complete
MPYTKKFLMSKTAATKRLARLNGTVPNGHIAVHVEINQPFTVAPLMEEFDARDMSHAMAIAEAWIVHMNAVSVGFHYMNEDASLENVSGIVDFTDFVDGEFQRDDQEENLGEYPDVKALQEVEAWLKNDVNLEKI